VPLASGTFRFSVQVGAAGSESSPRTEAAQRALESVEKPKAADSKEYLQKHNVEQQLMMVMRDVVIEQPEDPMTFISDRLAAGVARRRQDVSQEMVEQAAAPAQSFTSPAISVDTAIVEPQDETASVVNVILPMVADMVRDVARQQITATMASVNDEFKGWLQSQDSQRTQLLDTVAELTNKLDMVKANPELENLHALANEALVMVSAGIRDESLLPMFPQTEAPLSQMPVGQGMSGPGASGPSMDDFTKSILHDLTAMVTESLTDHVTVAMTQAKKEFEPWVQESDQKRDELLECIGSLQKEIETIGSPQGLQVGKCG